MIRTAAAPIDRAGLRRLRANTKHLSDCWYGVVDRHAYLNGLSGDAELVRLLTPSYAAHVHNAMLGVLVTDLIRDIGALILDRSKGSSSLWKSNELLRKPAVLAALQAEYATIDRLPGNWDDIPEDMRAAFQSQFEERERQRSVAIYWKERKRSLKRTAAILTCKTADKVRQARDRGVAHYDLVMDGTEWRTWQIAEANLTYGQIDRFVGHCSRAVETMASFVNRTSLDLGEGRRLSEKYLAEYSGALKVGLRANRVKSGVRRLRLAEQAIRSRGR